MSGKLFFYFVKGVAMGAANVIPGVSGGTIAFITGIYDKLIFSLKSFDLHALNLLLKFRISELIEYVNFYFLLSLFLGIGVSIFSLGKLLGFLFANYPVFTWSFFFGLIFASVYYVGRTVKKWKAAPVIMLVIGTAAAAAITFLNPAIESDNSFYLFLCGVVAICSMILPGLSGSFILILMGNYQLIFLQAVPELNLKILFPLGIGCVIGILALSRLIAYVLKHYRESTTALLTGFIFGSLLVIWPWKDTLYLRDKTGQLILKEGERIVKSYELYFPDANQHTLIAFIFMLIGILFIVALERMAERGNGEPEKG